jgi:hypothetical protein
MFALAIAWRHANAYREPFHLSAFPLTIGNTVAQDSSDGSFREGEPPVAPPTSKQPAGLIVRIFFYSAISLISLLVIGSCCYFYQLHSILFLVFLRMMGANVH